MKPYVAAALVATVTALAIPNINISCKSGRCLETLLPSEQVSHRLENQQSLENTRPGMDPLQITITVEVTPNEMEVSEENLKQWASMALRVLVAYSLLILL